MEEARKADKSPEMHGTDEEDSMTSTRRKAGEIAKEVRKAHLILRATSPPSVTSMGIEPRVKCCDGGPSVDNGAVVSCLATAT